MFGSENKLGITHLALHEIFEAVHQYDQEDLIAKVFISFYQIYLENVYDLLAESEAGPRGPPASLNIRSEGETSFQVEGLQQIHVKSKDQAFQVVSQGLQKRVVHSTAHNIRSSRSHAILQVHLDFEERVEDSSNSQKVSSSSSSTYSRNGHLIEKKYLVRRRTLTLVDLAGSERGVTYRQAAKQQLIEAGMINKSIAALGNCIYALSNREQQGDPNLHVPYRDCKLTRLLAEALGGNTKTCIIATISPCMYNYDETMSTLKFAARAKVVKKYVRKPRAEEYKIKPEIVPYLHSLEEGDEENEGMQYNESEYHFPPQVSQPQSRQVSANPYTQSKHPTVDQYAYQGYPLPLNHATSAPPQHTSQPPTQRLPSYPSQSYYPNGQPTSTLPPRPPAKSAPLQPPAHKTFAFEKPSQTFNLRDFLQACTMATKAFDPTSSEQYDLPPPSSVAAPDDMSGLGSGSLSTATPYAHGYASHPAKIESSVEVIPDEIDAYNRMLTSSSGSRFQIDTTDGQEKMTTSDFQFQTEAQSSNFTVKCHKGVQTWSMTPSAMEGKAAFDGTLDDFGSVKPPTKMDQVTEIDEETLMYTTNSIQDPTQRDELLKLAKLSPMEMVCSLAELRTAVYHLNEAVS
jgi:hypothetical protein